VSDEGIDIIAALKASVSDEASWVEAARRFSTKLAAEPDPDNMGGLFDTLATALTAATSEVERLRQALGKASKWLDELAEGDCGCPWIADDVGDGGAVLHTSDCLILVAEEVRSALDKGAPE
jgi:hypothetical protein